MENKDTKICPWCGEEIKKRAIICRFCFHEVTRSGMEAAEKLAAGQKPSLEEPEPAGKTPEAGSVNPSLSRLSKIVPKSLIEEILTGVETLDESERRPIAILFSDLSGFTPLTEELGAERMSDLLDEIYSVIRNIVARYGGVVEKFIGDAVMAVFGAPMAHGDDPERAIRAAYDIRREVRKIGREQGYSLDTHSGIAYGEVVIKTTAEGGHVDFRSIGDAVNLSSRLQGKAPTGDTLVDHRIYLQTRTSFEWEQLEPVRVKGKKDPIKVHKVTGIKKQFSKVVLGERIDLVPLVGRKKELEILKKASDKASEGTGQTVQITGEAGVGKSRIIYEFYQRLDKKKFLWSTGRCLSFGLNIPFLPFISLFKSILGYPREGGPPVTPEELTERINRIYEPVLKRIRSKKSGATLEKQQRDLYYSLAVLFSVDLDTNPLMEQSPRKRREHIFNAALNLIQILARQKPVILVFEDFHWADEDSLELMDHIIINSRKQRIMIVIMNRPQFIRSFPGGDSFTPLKVRELSDTDSRQLLEEILGTSRVRGDLKKLILERTEGNPFYMEEIILNLQEQGCLERKGEVFRLVCPVSSLAIPDSVEGVVLARLDRLEKKIKRILQCASVIGQEFRYQTLAQVADMTLDLQKYLVSLVDGDYLLERMLLPELVYIFRHIVLRDVTYGTLLDKRKRYFHARVAQALEILYRERIDEYVEIVAHHYEMGTIYHKAVIYLERAALKCEALYSQRAAADFWERLLKCLEKAELEKEKKTPIRLKGNIHLGKLCRRLGKPDRGIEAFQLALEDAETLDDRKARIDALMGMAEALRLSGKIQPAVKRMKEALELARKTKDEDLVASCLNFISHMERMRGNYGKALEAAGKVLLYSEKSRNRQRRYQALNHMGIILMYSGQPEKAAESFQYALALAREVGMKNEQVQIELNIGINHIRAGECKRAEKHLKQALSHATRLEFERGVQLALLAIVDLYLKKGEFNLALTNCRLLFKRMKEGKFSDIMAMALSNQARTFLGLGKMEKAWKNVEEAYDVSHSNGHYGTMIDSLFVLVDYHMKKREYKAALEKVEEAMKLIRTHREKDSLPRALLYQAEALLGLKRPDEAFVFAGKAVRAARKNSIPRDEAWALFTLSKCEKATGKNASKKHRGEAVNLAQKIEDHALLDRMKK